MKSAFYLLIGIFIPSFLTAQTECSPNNSFSEACQIQLANLTGTISGSIAPSQDKDYYYFTAPRSGVMNFSVSNVPANIIMVAELFSDCNQNQAIMSWQGNAGATVNGSKLLCPFCVSGKYYIKLGSLGSQQNTDMYSLTVSLDTSDTYECNNSFSECTKIKLDSTVHGAINTAQDKDYYCFDLPRSGIINFNVSNVPSTIFMVAELFSDCNQNSAIMSWQGGAGASVNGSKQICPFCPSGKYYMKLGSLGSQQNSGLYNFSVSLDTTDVYECNNSFSECAEIKLDSAVHGAINTAQDKDYYCFDVPRSGVINFSVTNVPSTIFMVAELFSDCNQNSAIMSWQGGAGASVSGSKLICPFCPSGKYYMKLGSLGSQQNAGLYTLNISLDTSDVYECNNVCADASLISSCDTILASINTIGDLDFYKFATSSGGTVHIKVTNVPSNIDIEGHLFSDCGVALPGMSSFSGSSGQSIPDFTYPLPSVGTYILGVNDKSNNANNADLYKLYINFDCVVSGTTSPLEGKIKIFPNPAEDNLNIDIGDLNGKDFSFSILNSMGEIILQERAISNHQTVDLGILPKGMYFLQIVGKEGFIIKQFIKM